MMKEIKGTNGKYLIDKNGKVFSVDKNKFLNHLKFGKGYLAVRINVKGVNKPVTIHRLIAETFIPNPKNKPCVNHLNGKKDDNRIENLEWATYSENNLHAFRTGLNVAILGSKRHTSTIDEKMVYKIREMYKTKKCSEISKELNLGYHLVNQVCLRKTWKHI